MRCVAPIPRSGTLAAGADMARTVLSTDPVWLKDAFRDLGVREVAGAGSNPRIVRMYAAARNPQVKDDAVPWCSAAMNDWIAQAGYRPTYSLAARSWLDWTGGEKLDLGKPIPRGAILIFRRGNAWQGHVTFCLEDHGNTVTVLGGNQGDSVSIATYSKAALIGARWPGRLSQNTVLQTGGASTASLMGGGGLNQAADAVQNNAPDLAGFVGQATDTFTQLSVYLRWASYVLVAISMVMLGVTVWHFVRTYLKPRAPIPVSMDGPTLDDELNGGQA